jgi:hypothetical protein
MIVPNQANQSLQVHIPLLKTAVSSFLNAGAAYRLREVAFIDCELLGEVLRRRGRPTESAGPYKHSMCRIMKSPRQGSHQLIEFLESKVNGTVPVGRRRGIEERNRTERESEKRRGERRKLNGSEKENERWRGRGRRNRMGRGNRRGRRTGGRECSSSVNARKSHAGETASPFDDNRSLRKDLQEFLEAAQAIPVGKSLI